MPSKFVEVSCALCMKTYMRRKSDVEKSIRNHGFCRCKKCTLSERNKKNSKPLYSQRIKKHDGRPEIKTKHGWRYLHVHIVESFIGRKLEWPGEVVYHCDHDKLNNKIFNLELMLNGYHTTQHHLGSKRNESQRQAISASKKGLPSTKRSLTFKFAVKIREDYKKGGISYAGLARKYNTTKPIIAHIIKRRYYISEE